MSWRVIIVFLSLLLGKSTAQLCSITSVSVSHNGTSGGGGAPLIGSSDVYTINCTVDLMCTEQNVTNLTISWNSVGNTSVHEDVPGETFFNSFTIGGPVAVANARLYECTAELENMMTSSNNESFIVMLQPPSSVVVTNATVSIGSIAMLNCTVTVANDISSLVNANITWTPSAAGSVGATVRENNRFTSMFNTSNADEYTCTANVINGSENILSSTEVMGSGTVYVVDISFNTSETVRLDVSPYNSFILQCNVSYYPDSGSPEINLTFFGNNIMDSLSNNVSSGPQRIQQAVTVTGASSESTFQYTCEASVSFAGSETYTESNSIIITVRGPAVPNDPVLLDPSVSPTSAVVRWKVPSVRYTPENFTVYYGLSSDNLNYSISGGMSNNIMNEGFLTDVDEKYMANISGLVSGNNYFYQVLSSNTQGNASSVIGNFTTGEAAPSEPRDVQLTVVNAAALTLTWRSPRMPNGNIVRYNYSCVDINGTETFSLMEESPIVTSVSLSGLLPFVEYMCNVTASTSAGTSNPNTDTAVTDQAAPNGSPLGFSVSSNNNNPRQLMLFWEPPERQSRNGIIIRYYYNCTNDDTSAVSGNSTSETTATINELKVFTNYTCRVTAATMVGQGPAATFFDARTGEDEPSEVTSLMSVGLNSSAFYISWNRPNPTNGRVSHYVVAVYSYIDRVLVDQANISAESITIVSSFEKGTPYNISVNAVTGGGAGQPTTITNFTEQGTPSAVNVTSVERINNTALRVSWTPLTIITAQGFITGYTITLTSIDSSRKQEAKLMQTVGSDVSSSVVTGLNSGFSYLVTIIVSNGENESPTSTPIVVDPINPPTIPTEKPVDDMTGVIVGVAVTGTIILCILIVAIIFLIIYLMRATSSKGVEIHTNPLALEKRGEGENGNELKLLSVTKDQEFNERMAPIKMSDFAEHVKQLHQNRDLGFEEEYESLKSIPPSSFTIAKLPANVPRNRFDNVYSYDDSCVVLSTADGGPDYINASFLNGYNHPKAYVAAQGPLPNTVGDFWRMIWEFQLPTVVMLTELVERGIEKCACYYPRNINDTQDVGHGLKVTLIEQQQFVEYKFKKFLLLNTSESNGGRLDVTHYHFLAWPDHGVPADKTVMMAFARRVRQTHPPEGPPLIVHCSAGVGRTGTFIVLDTTMQKIENNEDALNIYELVADMRRRRTLMVQTAAQYIYTHDALSEYIICGDTSITTKNLRDKMNELDKVSGGESGYDEQLKLLNKIARAPSEGHCSDSLSKQNVDKNRYSQLITSLPYNETRVHLKTTSGTGDYINASIVDGYKHRGAFLATQAPLETTATDLWRMMWDQWSASIVMLCSLDEEESMYQYWPEKVDEKCVYGMMEVKLISEKEEKDFIVRKLEVSQESNYINLATGSSDKLQVTQYQYLKWSPGSKPSNPASLLELLNQLLRTQKLSGNKAITVMCNDGVDRTGAFICLYSQLERVKVEGIADVFQFVKASRFHRPGLVQHVENYVFCHELLLEFLNTFDQYENFK